MGVPYRWSAMGVAPGKTITYAEVSDRDHFLTGRWRAFTTLAGVSAMVPVEHEPSRLHHAEVVALDEDLFIVSAGFSSGQTGPRRASTPGPPGVSYSAHRFVVGHWDESPIGPLDDVMWAWPDGTRMLLVDRREAAELITAVYRFDTVEVVALTCRMDGALLRVTAGELGLSMRCGRPWRIPLSRLRSRVQVRPLERLVARGLLGVRTWGISPTGVSEWYRADEYRRVVSAEACLDDQDLGAVGRFHEPARFGFSEPPRRPSMVRVRPLLHDPSGRLAEVAGDGNGGLGQDRLQQMGHQLLRHLDLQPGHAQPLTSDWSMGAPCGPRPVTPRTPTTSG